MAGMAPMWAMQQQQQPASFHQQMHQPAGSGPASSQASGQQWSNLPTGQPSGQQWSNLPTGFPILIPGPGGSLVPAGSMPPPADLQHQSRQNCETPFQQQPEASGGSQEEGDDILGDLPAGPQNLQTQSKMTRVPTKRFVIGGGRDSNGKQGSYYYNSSFFNLEQSSGPQSNFRMLEYQPYL